MSERVEGDRRVVSGRSAGSHFPRTQAETQFRLEADGTGRDGPFHIEGSVYGRQLRFRGPGAVLGSVISRGDLTFAEPGNAPARFLGGLNATCNIVSEPSKRGYAASLIADVERAAVVVRGDVIGDQVSIVDAVVFGNVRGRRVKITRSIVFGQVLARESAVIAASTLLAYDSPSVRFEGPCAMMFVAGTSDEAPTFAPYIDELGHELPSGVVFLPAMRALGAPWLSYRSWDAAAAAVERALLVPADWVKTPVEVSKKALRNGRVEEQMVMAERYVLSIGGRALNFGAVAPQLESANWLLRTALEYEHYAPAVQARTRALWAERCSRDELLVVTNATSTEPLAQGATGQAPAAPAAAPAAPAADEDPAWPDLYKRWCDMHVQCDEALDGRDYTWFVDSLVKMRAQMVSAGRQPPAFDVSVVDGRCRIVAKGR